MIAARYELSLTEVPVLVLLTPQRIDYDIAAPDGADLRFVGEGGGDRRQAGLGR
jgi:hypothetical protein